MKERIITFLKLLHLYSVAKTVYHWFDPVLYFFRDIVRRKRFIRDMDRVCEEIASMNPEPGGILAFGILCTDHKPTLIPFLEQIQTAAQKPIMFLDESRNADMPCPFPRICIPRSAPVKYDAKLKLTPMPEMERLIQQNPCLHQALKNITARLNNIHPEYAKVLLYRSYMIYQLVLDRWKPSEVMIWNEFNPLHTVFTEVCREKGIDPIFMEFGVLPGTFAIERGGQMGRSLIARNAEEFLQKPVSQEELEQGREVLNFLRSSGLNRNAQPRNDEMDVLRAKLKPGRPIILFAGQHDFDSGLTPYTEDARRYHSPMFATSLEAVNHLAEIAEENEWNLVFKPHPGMVLRYRQEDLSPNILFVSNVNLNDLIDQVDVVVTLMSQTAYVALIRERAVVTLGYNQLRHKGCNYEAYVKEDIERVLKDAISHGYTSEQRQNFICHTAQLLKYYLYDNLADRPIRYGKSIKNLENKNWF